MRAFDFLKLYGAIVFLHLATLYRQDDGVLYLLSKPLILGGLLLFFLAKVREQKLKGLNRIAWALLFSLGGDILLMNKENAHYFLLGMASFGLAHLFYILWYLKVKPKLNVVASLGSLAFAALGLWSLIALVEVPYELESPIYAYFTLLSIHLFLAANAWRHRIQNYLALVGIGLFIFSDWYLAFDKFGGGSPVVWLDPMIVMLSYAAAQAFIVMGVLRERLGKFDL